MLDQLPSLNATGATFPVLDTTANVSQTRYASSTLAPILNIAPASDGSFIGLSEKFQANPVNGTYNLTIPFKVTPSRNGSTPEIIPTYNSGARNGCFSLGWSMNIESVSRLTSRGVPRYRDDASQDNVADKDIFVLSGQENLVPIGDASSTE